MKMIRAVLLSVSFLVFSGFAAARDLIQVPEDACLAYTDMAIVARSLAVETIERERSARVIRLIYPGSDVTIAEAILASAYTSSAEVAAFVMEFFYACVSGQTGKFFGTQL